MIFSETTEDSKAKKLQMATSTAAAALAAAAIAKQSAASTSAAAAAANKNASAASAGASNASEAPDTAEKDAKPMYPRLFNKIVLTLENSLIPEEKLEETPSHTDGLDAETEKNLRILGCELIQTAGILLRLPQVAMATGQVLFQRFFYSKSFVRHNMETVAMSCLCLASKIEEAPRRIRDVINVFNHIKQVRAQKDIRPMILDHYYTSLKEQVIKAERRVLKELGFCVHVKHPHKLIVMYLQVLRYEKHEQLMQMSWNFMNDSLRTDVFMRYNPETIACACIYLSARKLSIPLPNNPAWFGIFAVNEEDVIDISYRVMDLYVRPKTNVEQLETAVDELKKRYMETRNKNKEYNTPPAVVAVDRNNGSHNAWGGFIQRAVPLPLPTDKRSEKDSRSRTHSRSRSASIDSEQQYKRNSKKSHRNKERTRQRERHRSRTRSRTPLPLEKSKTKKRSNYEKSPSSSPQIKRHKSKISRENERHRERDYERDYERDRERNYERDARAERDYERDRERGERDYFSSQKERYSGGTADKYRDKYYEREYFRPSGSANNKNRHNHHNHHRGMATHRSRDRKR